MSFNLNDLDCPAFARRLGLDPETFRPSSHGEVIDCVNDSGLCPAGRADLLIGQFLKTTTDTGPIDVSPVLNNYSPAPGPLCAVAPVTANTTAGPRPVPPAQDLFEHPQDEGYAKVQAKGPNAAPTPSLGAAQPARRTTVGVPKVRDTENPEVSPCIEPDERAPSIPLMVTAEHEAEQDEKTIESLLIRLAELSELGYQRRRTSAAKSIGLKVGVLDKLVKQQRAEIEATTKLPALFPYWQVEPWPETVDGRTLILSLVSRIRLHVVMSPESTLVCALWIIMAWAHKEVAVHSPILMVTSAEPNSGKSTLLGVLGFLVPRPLACVGITAAVLYRSIELWAPTLTVDEADAIFVHNEDLRAVYNSGWTRGTGVVRCGGDEQQPRFFSTFCPKILGLKGKKLPDTTMSRTIIIEMRRKLAIERALDFQHLDDEGFSDLRRQLSRWVSDNVGALTNADPIMPDGFENRLRANWRLLLAIADVIGGEWPEKARAAAMKLANVATSNSLGVKLLLDIRRIFHAREAVEIASRDLIEMLTGDPERGWSEWRDGKTLTQRHLAGLLGPFGVASEDVRPGGIHARGYKRSRFEGAFGRYLEPSGQKPTSEACKRANPDSAATSDEILSVRGVNPHASKNND